MRIACIESLKPAFKMSAPVLMGVWLLVQPAFCQPPAAATPTRSRLSVGIVPQQSATRLARLWGPMLAYLSQASGYALDFKTAKDIPTFQKRLAEGQYDIAYMNPYHYTVFHARPGYLAFAKERDKKIQGILVVQKQSVYDDIAQLSGTTVAFPAPAAFAATVLPRAYFRVKGIAVTPQYVSSHDSVYRAVAQGLYPAGGGILRTFNTTAAEVRDSLRVLWSTAGYTPHAIAVHPRVPAEAVASIQTAMCAMGDDMHSRKLLNALGFKGITTATDRDWDDVRALRIDLLESGPTDQANPSAGKN